MATSASAATGQQHELRLDDQVAVVVERGGGLRTYTCDGRDVVDGYPADALPDAARGQLLAPWPNRIRDGSYRWDGADHQLELSEPAKSNAIHGLVRTLPFALAGRTGAEVRLRTSLAEQPGYPHRLDIEVRYALRPGGLDVQVSAVNTGAAPPAPYAVGQHPYLTAGSAHVDDTVLTLPADSWLPTDDRAIPVAEEPVDGTPYDFREPRRIGDLRLDTAFRRLRRDGSGRAVATVADPAAGTAVELWVDRAADCLQVFTGDTISEVGRRRRSVAIEPMSAPPDAFRSGEGLVRLEPGATFRLGWGIAPVR